MPPLGKAAYEPVNHGVQRMKSVKSLYINVYVMDMLYICLD